MQQAHPKEVQINQQTSR